MKINVTLPSFVLWLCSSPVFAVTIVNGDFSQGLTGFQSQYTAVTSASNGGALNGMYPEGTVTVDSSAAGNHFNWSVFGQRNGTKGEYALFNGSPNANSIAWMQTVNGFDIGNAYSLTMYAASLFPTSPGMLQLWAGSDENSLQKIGEVKTLTSTTGEWQFVAAEFIANTSSMVLAFTGENTIRYGNDFAVDDIAVYKGGLQDIPEPSTYLMMASGLVAIRFYKRRA